MIDPMKIALLQARFVVGDLAGNAARIVEAAHQATTRGARLLVCPCLLYTSDAADE